MSEKNYRIARRAAAIAEEIWIFLFGWIPTPLGMLLRLIFWKCLFRHCGKARFETGLTFVAMRNISIASGARIGKRCFMTADKGLLEVDENCAIAPCVNIGADNGIVKLGKFCAIGPGTVIRAANHRFDKLDRPICRQGHLSGKVVIENDVWIGANCVITPDVVIGEGAIVGAGAVVTKNVEAWTIVGGVPARFLARREAKAKVCPCESEDAASS